MIRTQRPTKFFAALLAYGALSTMLAACGEKQETEEIVTQHDRVSIVLNALPNATHAAIYAAQAAGDFARAGLDVTIQAPTDPAAQLKLLEAGTADFVVTQEPELLLARADGAKVQAVNALVQKPLSALISLPKQPVRTPADLEGKTIGTAGLAYQRALLDSLLRAEGVKPARVSVKNLGLDVVKPLVRGQVTASLGFWNTDAIVLEAQKKRPIVVKVDEALDVPNYDELVIAATERTVSHRGPVVRRFVQAIGLGAAAIKRDPSVGLDALEQANPQLDRAVLEQSLAATLPLMFPAKTSRPYGWLDPLEWAHFSAWMQGEGMLETGRIGARATTNEYLAGEGVGDEGDS